MHTIFNNVITENIPNLENVLPIQVQEAFRTPDLSKIEPPHSILSLKQHSQRKNIEGYKREKKQITYKGKPTNSQQISQWKCNKGM
jgi:hypothetical protein